MTSSRTLAGFGPDGAGWKGGSQGTGADTTVRRLRWSVPRVDESTNAWLDQQHDISRSLQLLIRESIERDGIIDVVNRPVHQLPGRGRPPGSGAAENVEWEPASDDVPVVPVLPAERDQDEPQAYLRGVAERTMSSLPYLSESPANSLTVEMGHAGHGVSVDPRPDHGDLPVAPGQPITDHADPESPHIPHETVDINDLFGHN